MNHDGRNHIPIGTIDYSVVRLENAFDNLEAVLQFHNQFLIARNLHIYASSAVELENLMILTSANFSTINNRLSNAVIPISEAEQIRKSYLTALVSLNSVVEFTAYSKEIELLIINSQQLLEIEEQYLLTNMATVRHHFCYWMRSGN